MENGSGALKSGRGLIFIGFDVITTARNEQWKKRRTF